MKLNHFNHSYITMIRDPRRATGDARDPWIIPRRVSCPLPRLAPLDDQVVDRQYMHCSQIS